MNLKWIVILSVFLTSGCMKSVFDGKDARCPFVERGGCQSMEMVDKMVREKHFTHNRDFVLDAKSANQENRCKGGKSCWKK